jgi:hypothetical protein
MNGDRRIHTEKTGHQFCKFPALARSGMCLLIVFQTWNLEVARYSARVVRTWYMTMALSVLDLLHLKVHWKVCKRS